MHCIHINIRQAILVVLSVLINGVQHSQLGDNYMDLITEEVNTKNTKHSDKTPNYVEQVDELHCPKDLECHKLNPDCFNCNLNISCEYGNEMNVTCDVGPTIQCKGERKFNKMLTCRYCYQTEPWEHTCELKANCDSVAKRRSPYVTNCTVHNDILCLGRRTFNKNVLCNWTGGYRWSTALALSITLGGFGADRFYLGHWQEGIGKLFSFGGLGVWTLIDVILISLHYLGPVDGSLYI